MSDMGDMMDRMGGMMGGGWVMMAVGFLLVLAIIAAVVVGIMFLVRPRESGGSRDAAGDRQAPIDVLRERFARGEIDRDEFERRRKTLGGHAAR